MENSNFLGTEKISKLIIKFSIPCVLSLLVSALYNIVDQIFIGNSELSTLGNAATGVVFPIFIIAQAFAWCFGDGCAAYLNICQGRNDSQNAHKAIGTGITVTLICSMILIIVFYPLKTQILTLFGASENSIDYAVEYFNLILAFFSVHAVQYDECCYPCGWKSHMVYGFDACGSGHQYHSRPRFYFRNKVGNVRSGACHRYGTNRVFCNNADLFLPHENL